MKYDRKLKYLEYRERGNKLRGAGFVKLEVWDGRCHLLLQISGLRETDTYRKKLYLISPEEEKLFGELEIAQGSVQMEWKDLARDNLGGTGISYEQLEGLRIPLGSGREIYCCICETGRTGRESGLGNFGWQEQKKAEEAPEERQEERGSLPEERQEERRILSGEGQKEMPQQEVPKREAKEQPEGQVEVLQKRECREELTQNVEGQAELSQKKEGQEEILQKRESEGEVQTEIQEVPRLQEILQTEEKMQDSLQEEEAGEETREEIREGIGEESGEEIREGTGEVNAFSKPPQRPDVMEENKWSQLWKVYPHIAPFDDERDFLSIGPVDFVVLPEKYYAIVNNSFLLHGYYNYHHLILCRRKAKDGNRYYIGVPGNFYEKEKQVALLFGFESFECKTEPAQTGDYGYYMMRIYL